VIGGFTMWAILAIVALIVLGARDADRRRQDAAYRSDTDLIALIVDGAGLMTAQLKMILSRHEGNYDRSTAWIPTVLEFYLRLETLALSPSASVEACEKLAADASRFVRQQRLKGIPVSDHARRLSMILKRRTAG